MPSLIDSGRIVPPPGPPFSVRESASRCGFTFPLYLRQFLSTPTPGCPFPECVRLHIKVLQAPNVPIETSLKNMQQVYSTASIRVEVGSREDFIGNPAFSTLLDLDVGACTTTQTLTTEQQALFANNANVGSNDVAVYFVRSIIQTPAPAAGGVLFGCAGPGSARCAVVAAPVATPWTLAHEVGHILGLDHPTGETCPVLPTDPRPTILMTGCGTNQIVGIPTLSATEQGTIQSSSLSQAC